ncbi:MAG: hypothetical protein Q9195_004964 [Heterodermia aff. obscurata]
MSRLLDNSLHADNEWSPLRAVIVGKAGYSRFPNDPLHMIKATMPPEHHQQFTSDRAFPPEIVRLAEQELNCFVSILRRERVLVYRPKDMDWGKVGGYTAAMPRDGLIYDHRGLFCMEITQSRDRACVWKPLQGLAEDKRVTVVRAPKTPCPDTIYDGVGTEGQPHTCAINNSRPAFDAADFLRFGKTLLGQLSNVTNLEGLSYLRRAVPDEYTVKILDITDPHAMHIDATLLPLRDGLLVYNPARVTEEALKRHSVLASWELHAYPFSPRETVGPPLYMTSPWIVLNLLSLDGKRVIVEAQEDELADWLETLGMEPIRCPFRNVNSLGGSFHCATVDLVRHDCQDR